MRVLTLCYEFPPLGGGGGAVVQGLATALSDLGHEIDVVTMGFAGLPRQEKIGKLRIFRTRPVRRRRNMCTSREMLPHLVLAAPLVSRLIGRSRYDLLHAHFIFPDGVLAQFSARRAGLPYIITAHGSDVPGYNPDRFGLQHRVLKPAWRFVVGRAALVICPSGELRRLVDSHHGSVATAIIPNGLDTRRFSPREHDRPRVLVVSRMFKRKGIQHLLAALEKLDIDLEVNIVGDGPYLDALRAMPITGRARVRFRGWLDNDSDELTRLYETSSIFVLPSVAENFPVSLLEAMAAGMAIITTSGTGCAEVVGDSGVLVRPGSTDDIGEALKKLGGDPGMVRRLGERARARIESEFTWERVAKRYDEVYRTVTAERNNPAAGSPRDR